MAKRRPDDALLHDSPSKKHCRAFCKLDMRVGGMAPVGGVNPPSLLALLGNRARKRPRYFEDPEQQDEEPSASLCRRDTRKHAAGGLSDQTSGNFCERPSSSSSSSISKKRTRDSDSETVRDDKEKVDADVKTEDCTYNSFQFWRVPLPQLDLSLLEEASSHSRTEEKSKCKNSFSEAMET